MKGFFKEFKAFAMRGNVLDLAVGVIIGGAFSAIVTSLTDNLINPIIGIFGEADFSAWMLRVRGSEIKYGAFITSVINFLILAFVVFLLVKVMNRALNGKKGHDAPAAPMTKECPYCKTTINIEASRCPNCTSELSLGEKAA